MSNDNTARDAAFVASKATLLREVVCPDGTQFAVYEDGTWEQYCWDGSFVRDSSDHDSTGAADVLLAYAEGPAAAVAAQRA